MTSVRWGIISTAKIGMEKVIPAIQAASNCDVVAIASRLPGRAADAADLLGIPSSFDTYQDLLDAEDIDAVYIPLPNDQHAEWAMRAARAGKHVLCEKPLAMSAAQAEEIVQACSEAGVLLMEAFMYRHHPTWVTTIDLVRSGAVGEVQAVHSWFSYFNDDPSNIRNQIEHGGGALMDIGCYCISLSRLVFEDEPSTIEAIVKRDPVLGVDTVTSAVLAFPRGGQAVFTCSTRAEDSQGVHIIGTGGRIEIDIPFNIPPLLETRIHVTAGGDPPVEPASETIVFPPANQYTIQAERFAEAILDDGPVPVHPIDAVRNMAVIDAILASGGVD